MVLQQSSFERGNADCDGILAGIDAPSIGLLMLRLNHCVRHSSGRAKLTAVKCVEIGGCDGVSVQLTAGQAVESTDQAEGVVPSAEVADAVWYVEEKLLSGVVGSMPWVDYNC